MPSTTDASTEAQPTGQQLADRLRTGWATLAALRGHVEAGEPWPLSDNFGTEPEATWGPRETLAHVQEMLPFWLGEIERILEHDQSGRAQPFGRVATDEIRLAVIERDRTLPLRELFSRIEESVGRTGRRLGELADDELARRGEHPRLGPMTVAQVVDRFVCGHLEEHAVQLREAISR
jgi:hypothetical protein